MLTQFITDHALERKFKDGAYLYRSIFVWFLTMREKKILSRAIEIHIQNWGQPSFFQR